MSAVLVGATALLAGYLLGSRQVPARVFDALEAWANARTGRVARAAVQPVYLLLIVGSFLAGPGRFVRNVRAHRAEQHQERSPAVQIGREVQQ